MSQEEVANSIGISRTAYNKYESGIIKPVRKLEVLSQLFGVTTDYILGQGDIFQEHIINFLKSHINSWSEPGEFRGIQEFIDFYNDVLISPDTVEEGKQPIRRRRY